MAYRKDQIHELLGRVAVAKAIPCVIAYVGIGMQFISGAPWLAAGFGEGIAGEGAPTPLVSTLRQGTAGIDDDDDDDDDGDYDDE